MTTAELLSHPTPATQLAVLHRIAARLADKSTLAGVATGVTSELHAAFQATWVALYRLEQDGAHVRSALAGNESEAPPERITGDHGILGNSSLHTTSASSSGKEGMFGREALIAMLSHYGDPIGVIALGARSIAEPFTARDAEFLQLIATIVTPHLVYLESRHDDRSESLSDPVTGLGNRRAFEERIGEELARSNRSGFQLALLVCAPDEPLGNGQSIGDDSLRAVVDALRQSVRLSDPAFRTGPRQFSALLVRSSAEGALVAAKRLHAAAAGIVDREGRTLTLSIGIGALKAGVQHKPLDLAAVALTRKGEDALRIAMESGGNRAVVG